MNQRTKAKYKRVICLLFALVIIAANAPVSPPAKATAGILPMPAPPSLPFIPHGGDMAYYQNPLVDGYDNADIFALIEATMAAQRAAGVQYVSDLGNGAYVPSEDAIGHMLESAIAVYNGLEAVERSSIWNKAGEIAAWWAMGVDEIKRIHYDRGLLDAIFRVRQEHYPAVNTFNAGDWYIEEVENNPMWGLEFVEYGQRYGNPVNYERYYRVPIGWIYYHPSGIVNGQGYINGVYQPYGTRKILLGNPVRWEDVDGLYYWFEAIASSSEHPPQNRYLFLRFTDTTRTVKFLVSKLIDTASSIISYEYAPSVPDVTYEEFGIGSTNTVTNDAPEELPAEVTMTLPPAWTAPDFSEAFQRWKAINAMSGADVYSPPIPVPPGTDVWDGKAKADELRDLLWSIWTLLQGLLGFDRLLNGIKEFHDSIPERVTEAEYKEIRSRIETIEGMIDLINPGAMTEAETEAAAAAAEKAAADTKAETDAGTDNPAIPDTGVGSKVDFSPLLSFTGLASVFPFCLPWDMVNLYGSLNAPRQTPRIVMQLPPFMFNTQITIDLSMWNDIAALVRNLVLGLFVLGLILVSRTLIKW